MPPDGFVYEQVGEELLQSWQGLRPAPEKAGGTKFGYYTVNAAFFFILGRGPGAPVALNILLASWVALPVYYLTLAVVRGNHAVARLATALTLFFPSLILWSVLNIREAPTIFLLVSAACFFARFQQKAGANHLLGGVLCLLGLLVFREYLMVMVGLSAGAGVAMGKSRSPLASLAGGGVLLMGLTFLLQSAGLGGTLAEEPTLERIQYLRQDLAFGAGSAFGIGADVSTVGGAVGFLPIGLVYFLLAPFPWSVTSVLQQVTLPESLVWYVLFLCVLRGIWLALKYDASCVHSPGGSARDGHFFVRAGGGKRGYRVPSPGSGSSPLLRFGCGRTARRLGSLDGTENPGHCDPQAGGGFGEKKGRGAGASSRAETAVTIRDGRCS